MIYNVTLTTSCYPQIPNIDKYASFQTEITDVIFLPWQKIAASKNSPCFLCFLTIHFDILRNYVIQIGTVLIF